VKLFISQAIQRAYKRSMEEATIARMQEQMNEKMDWRKGQMQQEIDDRIAAYFQEHGFMPGQGGEGDDSAVYREEAEDDDNESENEEDED